MHQNYPFVPSKPSSYIHHHRSHQLTWVYSSHELYGTRLHSLQLGSHVDTCLLRCGKISYLFGPPQCSSFIHQHNSKRIRLTLSSSLSFSFSSSCFVVFVVFIPRSDRGVVSADLVDSSRRVLEFLNMCGWGEFDGCEKRIWPFLDDTLECGSESIMLQKTRKARAGGELNKGNFAAVTTHTSYAPVQWQAQKMHSQVERRLIYAAPGLGGRVCVVVGSEDGNWSFL